jgi:II/X family phage/plasmid replication protein
LTNHDSLIKLYLQLKNNLLDGFLILSNLWGYDSSTEFAHPLMCDWMTIKICKSLLPESTIRYLESQSSKLFKVNAQTGELEWESYCYESVRSDTHQICFRIGVDFSIQGSPARIGNPNNAFGALDLLYCAGKMIRFAAEQLDLDRLPDIRFWRCTRVDLAANHIMQSGAEARQALAYLKQSPEGRQKHSFESNGLYIGKRSTLNRGKIYLKGQDAKRNQRYGRAEYTELQLQKAERLLRSELTLARHFFRRLKDDHNTEWYELTTDKLIELHNEYFKEYFSQVEVTDMSNIEERLLKFSPTEGQARSAFDCYFRIRSLGYEQAKGTYSTPTWYRHIKNLKSAGLTRADLVQINVIPLKKRAICIGEPARYWDDIDVA